MAIHTPVIRPRTVPAAPSLVPVAIAVIILALLATVVLMFQPKAETQNAAFGYSQQRHGEIMEGWQGPHPEVLRWRQGEINAANE